ncbi:MAG: tungsten ABC transporter permease [Gammaproteobacteria bacterium]|nr:tungsten ABC transporter permease [Pseudomonadales bacterium]MCP5347327.1 tungsten ABC transporter permease [Pseudomonadales bacterium]
MIRISVPTGTLGATLVKGTTGTTRWLLILFLIMPAPIILAAEEVRVAVIGGLERTGDWERIRTTAERRLNLQISTVLSAPKEQIVPVFMRGEAELLLIHGGDETFALEALGLASPSHIWAYNDFVIAGPEDDPAGVAGAESGSEALRKIQTNGQSLISFRDPGSHQILDRLLEQAGLIPAQINLRPDSVNRPQQILRQAAQDRAYVIVGHIPVAFGRMPSRGIKVLFTGDPSMRSGYVAVTPGPEHPADPAARHNAERLAQFLISPQGQELLYDPTAVDGARWLYPRQEATGLLSFPEQPITP